MTAGSPAQIGFLNAVSGTCFLSQAGSGSCVVGGIGAACFSPEDDGLNSATRLWLDAGGGHRVPLGKHVGPRLQARAFVTLINSDGGMFCGNHASCVVQIKGDTLVRSDVMAGLSVRF